MRGIRLAGLVVLTISVVAVAQSQADTITVTKKTWKTQVFGMMTYHYCELEGTYTSTGAPTRVDNDRLTGVDPEVWIGFGSDTMPKDGKWKLSTPLMGAVPPNMTFRSKLIQGAVLLAVTEFNVTFP